MVFYSSLFYVWNHRIICSTRDSTERPAAYPYAVQTQYMECTYEPWGLSLEPTILLTRCIATMIERQRQAPTMSFQWWRGKKRVLDGCALKSSSTTLNINY